MSKDKENIDHLFREGLSEYSEQPPSFIWNSIEDEISARKKRKAILIFWQGISAAAVITIAFILTLLYNNSNINGIATNNTITNSILKSQEEIKTNLSPKLKSNNIPDNPILFNKSTSILNSDTKKNTTTSYKNKRVINSIAQNNVIENKGIQYNIYSEENKLIRLESKEPCIENFYEVDYKGLDDIKHSKQNKTYYSPFINQLAIKDESDSKGNLFSLSGSVSPTYAYRTTSESNRANEESGITSLSGGLNINIKASKRFQIETGVLYAQLGQKFSNSSFSPKRSIAFLANAENTYNYNNEPSDDFNNSLGKISADNNISADMTLGRSSSQKYHSPELNSNNTQKNSNDINVQQELDYIEVPINFKYYVLDKRYKLLLTSGISSNFLVGNAAYSIKDGAKSFIGNIEGLNRVSYSASFGFGIKTPLSKSFDLNIEPRFKYFFNSISSSDQYDFKPYSFGVFSGVSYNF